MGPNSDEYRSALILFKLRTEPKENSLAEEISHIKEIEVSYLLLPVSPTSCAYVVPFATFCTGRQICPKDPIMDSWISMAFFIVCYSCL